MELPPSSKYVARRDEPVSDDERQSLEKRLNAEFEAGRITQDDYMSSLDKLYEARTMGELVPVVKRVPDATSDVPAIVPTGSGRPGELAPIRDGGALKPLVYAGVGLGALLALLVLVLVIL